MTDYITKEQACEAVKLLFYKCTGSGHAYLPGCFDVCDALRAIQPQETSVAFREWHEWRLVGTTDAEPGQETARYRCADCGATVDLPPTVRGSLYALSRWLDRQAGECREKPKEPSERITR